MGTILSVIDDDFNKEKEFGYIEDVHLSSIVKKSNENSLSCLRNILGYENTIFNSAQMNDIENEIDKLSQCFKDKKIIEILENIKDAISFAKKDPPSYLFFEGD